MFRCLSVSLGSVKRALLGSSFGYSPNVSFLSKTEWSSLEGNFLLGLTGEHSQVESLSEIRSGNPVALGSLTMGLFGSRAEQVVHRYFDSNRELAQMDGHYVCCYLLTYYNTSEFRSPCISLAFRFGLQ